ncbi:MAG TPA: toll/interleukin-1 receptor domain-containing protein [Candidatus Blautia faecipullorum]|nr:toll/interleukin-1 receptor domain-containing protein [Candidatus Blautia faecipullorum]
MISVFISHNYMDKPLARKISNTLNYYGIQTWIDESEIKVGDSLIAKIRTGIDNVDYIIALISKYSVESEWVLKELDIAMNKEIEGKKVVVLPVLAGKCNLPGFLKGKLYVDMSTTKNFSKNLPKLLSRFNIENILPGNEHVFTSSKLSLVEIICKLSDAKKELRIDTWKSLSYSDKQIFLLDEFRNFIIKYLQRKDIDIDELIELLKAYDRCANKDKLLDSYYLSLLDTKNKKMLDAVIHSIIIHNINNQEVVDKIIEILRIETDKDNIIACLKYFGKVHIFNKKEELLEVCDFLIENNSNKQIFGALIKTILFQFGDDDGIRRIIKLYSESEDAKRKQIITIFASMGSEIELISFYIRSPRLRDEFKKIILGAFSEEDDLLNADIICTLFVTEELEYIFPKTEIWEIVKRLDDYSVLALLERISYDYNVTNVFNSTEDVQGFSEMLERSDSRIRGLVFDILADVSLKSAIDVLVKFQYEPKYYNVDNILITLLKETNIKNYEEFYLLCRKVKLENCDEIEKILLLLCDYIFDNSKITELVSAMQIDLGKIDMDMRDRRKMLRFICDILDKQIDLFDGDNAKNIKQFIKKAKQYCNRTD